MQFKKLLAVGGSILMGGLALASPVLAAYTVDNVASLVSAADDTVTFPMFVVGADAKTIDVAGALNIAVGLAAGAKQETTSTTTLSTETVTGDGATISTAGNSLNPWEMSQSVKGSFGSGQLPTLLKTETFQAASAGNYEYKQYIYINGETTLSAANSGRVIYDRATSGASDLVNPKPYYKLLGGQVAWTYKLSFSTAVAMSSATTTATLRTILQGQPLRMLGKDYVISDCTYTSAAIPIADLTLLGGKNTVSLSHVSGSEEYPEETVTVDGKEFKIKFKGVTSQSSTNYASFDMNGKSYSLSQGSTQEIDGVTIGIVTIGSTSVTGGIETLKLALGAEKIKIFNSGTVQKGSTTNSELTASITATATAGWSELKIIYTPSSDKWIGKDEVINEPLFGAFDLKFTGITPTLTDTESRQTIEFTPSATNMLLKYENADGIDYQMYGLYYDATATTIPNYRWIQTTTSTTGNDNTYKDIVFDEAQNISAIDDDYFVLSSGGYSRVMQFTELDAANSQLTFTGDDGQTVTSRNTSETAGILTVGGNDYDYYILGAGIKKTINMDLNNDGDISTDTTAAAYTGTEGTDKVTGVSYSHLMPKLVTSGQGGLYFFNGNKTNATMVSGQYWYPDLGFLGIRVGIVDNTSAEAAATMNVSYFNSGAWTAESSTITLDFDGVGFANATYSSPTYIDYHINCRNTSITGPAMTTQCFASVGSAIGPASTAQLPGYILVEEAQEGSTTHSWIRLPIAYDSTNSRVYMNTPVSDDSNYASGTSVLSTSTEYKGMTTYGTLVEYQSSTLGGVAKFTYPDSAVYGNVWYMETGSELTKDLTSTGYEVIPITTDIVKLDTEVTDTDKSNYDFVLVGGPCVNKLTAEVLELTYPACGESSGITENTGIIKFVEDAFTDGKVALVVAGWEGKHTDYLCRAIQTGSSLLTSTADVTLTEAELQTVA